MPIRFDRTRIKARRTDEGYIVDTPVLGRTGIQVYRNNDGTLRRELRLPEEVFHDDSLASFVGKPVTDEHPSEPVTSQNAITVTKGAIVGTASREDDNVVAQVVVYDAGLVDKILTKRSSELSLGYSVDLDMTPGVWQGQHYDAVQRNIRINHLAVVPAGRAGNAKFNVDAAESEPTAHEENTVKLKLDNGLEYDVPAEVEVAYKASKAELASLQAAKLDADKRIDAVTAERDMLKTSAPDVAKIKADALEEAKKLIAARAAIEKIAGEFNVDHQDKTDRQVKEAVIKSDRAEMVLDGKSDEYVNAAFDLVVSGKADRAAAAQRITTTKPITHADNSTVIEHGDFMKNLANLRNKAQ